MDYYLSSADAALEYLKTGAAGLTRDEAERRLLQNGRNELEKAKKKSLLRRFADQILNLMILVLLAAAAVSVAIAAIDGGTLNDYAEAGIILAVVILNSVLGVIQESKADKAIEALQEMSASTAKVIRGGIMTQIPAGELVTGDIVLIEAGDAVPADMRLIRSVSLRVEEASLTGESVPVEKSAEALREDENGGVPLGDRVNMAFMGSDVTYGRGEGVVTAAGMDTEMGKIALFIQSAQESETPLQKRLSQLGKILSLFVLCICAAVFLVRLITTGDYSVKAVLDSFMLAVSLAVAAIPEGLAAVVTIVLSIGVTKMAKRNAIIRRLTAVETLGCAQVICSDKTGTLTQNKMTVTESYGDTEILAKSMALCCDSRLSSDGTITGDPTENALIAFALEKGFDKNRLEAEFPREAEEPFDSIRKMMSTVHRTPAGFVQYTKGAPDEILQVCTHALVNGQTVELTPAVTQKITSVNNDYAGKALRVLACAFKEPPSVTVDREPAVTENGLTFIGLEAMIDPVRPEVRASVDECKSSGIKVVMITGDHKDTAAAIARELGIITSSDQTITGQELSRLTDDEFESRIENTFVYARVQPEHKVRIVNMWKHKGYVTAMTGDGVNDAPAIKSGDIGVGMGITGTDVTKNVADMVLADDNFATIVAAVEEGRRIYDNIKKTVHFLLSSNLSEVISVFAAALMRFVLFKPVHLLFINLITDSLPAIALGMESAEPDIMEHPPRGLRDGIFSGGVAADVLYQGILIALLTLASYKIADIWRGHGIAMTAAFLTMSMCEIFHAYNMRSQRQSIFTLKTHNKVLWSAMALSFLLTLLIIYVPVLADIFSLEPLTIRELITSLGLSVLIIPLVETVKAVQRLLK